MNKLLPNYRSGLEPHEYSTHTGTNLSSNNAVVGYVEKIYEVMLISNHVETFDTVIKMQLLFQLSVMFPSDLLLE